MLYRAFAFATLAISAPIIAQAQPVTGPYVSLGGGADFLQNIIEKPYNGFGPAARSYKFSVGAAAQGSIGYGLGNGLRLELEGDYAHNDVRGVAYSAPLRASGSVQQYGGFFNALYDFDFGLPVYPYLGVGAGYQEVELNNVASGTPGTALLSGSQSQGAFAYQGMAGLSYPLPFLTGLSLTAEYRFIGVTTPPAYNRSNGSTNVAVVNGSLQTSRATFGNIFNHEALIGLRYTLFAPPAAPIEAEPTPTPAQTAARTYLVFFDWDRADLTDRARQIIAQAARATTQVAVTRIEVDGNTDTTGTARYNQVLSVRRAEAVAAELVRQGVPRAAITAQGFGFNRLLVQTGPGVREPQNRRVEIILR